jgi:hypothetical protein
MPCTDEKQFLDDVVLLGFTPCRLVGRYQHLEEHTASAFRADDGYGLFPRNCDIGLRFYTALEPRKTKFLSSPP